jgi:hypothetical protein
MELPEGHAANPQSPSESRAVASPGLSEDASTLTTAKLLNQEPPAPSQMSMDHGKMDHGTMNHSTNETSPTDTYTCSMHPEVQVKAPGDCPICGMKLVKKKPTTHAD